MDQYIGKLLDNRYEILELVGTGGMAKVYKARCHRLNRLVAIKILREDLAQDAEFRRRFHDESQAVAMLSHPNIVAVYDVSRSSDLEYIVMELIDGITLKQYMQKKGNKLNWREALHFITQVVKALGHAHSRGIIHRDIKPHNIMVLRDGSVKVADFGIARVASGGHSTLTQEALGSVHYISPEQARGSHIDARSDLYSAGVVLYEMITGRLPFEGDTPVSVAIQHINSIPLSPRELDSSIPEALESITMKAMAPSPDSRYLSADEMLADLEEFRKNPNINFDYSALEFDPEEEPEDDRTQIRPIHTGGRHASGERPLPDDFPQSHSRSYEYEEERHGQRRSRHSRQEEDYPPTPQRRQRYEDEEDDYPRRGPVWPIFLAAIAVLLFVGLVVYFLVQTIFPSLFSPSETYPVPNLIGQVYEEIKDDTDLLGRYTLVEGETVADEAEPGTIIDQDPRSDKEVLESVTEIKVTISGGPDTVEMPPLDGMDYNTASIQLRGIGLKPVVPPEYQYDDEIKEGYIISYTPQEGLQLPPGTEVQMVVSKGPAVKELELPNFEGMTKEMAEKTITQRNLDLENSKFEEVYDPNVEAGKVISQYPIANTKVTEGTAVNLIISKGPDPATLPPDPPAVDDPGPDVPPSTPVTKFINVKLDGYEGMVNIRVLLDGAEVGSGTADAAMESSVDIPVHGSTGMGVREVAVYINGVAGGTHKVDFDS
ncbi:Stk1 family PASTA domain-containing Ser/Thr kinase [Colidextribacter sp. OB.20]|uniref:Stk1 family PASTA domain-containing Ser/Thr kinase n=1 Tax=Colidextribacter sp. OB.20 TaxID=2304568 RepID=UPI00136DB45B|nr:Stk1 family PASTA domain-containing Ser/Thr kinase [Colidextribacter sp. OB.20]